jgi:hypothetical protein
VAGGAVLVVQLGDEDCYLLARHQDGFRLLAAHVGLSLGDAWDADGRSFAACAHDRPSAWERRMPGTFFELRHAAAALAGTEGCRVDRLEPALASAAPLAVVD